MGSMTEYPLTRSERLVTAAKNGDIQQTVELLRHIPKDFNLGRNGECVLREIVRNGHMLVLDLLLDRGVSPVATDNLGMAPLHIAVENNHTHIVQHLITKAPKVKENINQVCREGYTAYQLAMKHNHAELASKLVELGAEPRDLGIRSRFNSMTSSRSLLSDSDAAETDYVLKLCQHENAVDESVHRLQQQVSEMTSAMQESFKDMKKMVAMILSKQAKDTNKQLAELKRKMDNVEQNIVHESEIIHDGMDVLRSHTENLRTTFHQSEEYNDMVYFHVFQIIAKTVGMKRNTWRALCESLLADYPKELVNKIMTEVARRWMTRACCSLISTCTYMRYYLGIFSVSV